ncbi:small GTP-binding protein [Salirhabdus euzebyi]|uniref:Small GTP-binding protein n=1 Tax=Salirhabdus euzebyi TaxID=394506 RepID=A0A841Q1X5_9BACI|nr:dynamin family protein [Salirhabdus euzebyi]MBB6452302.1 small GTP-binding protein [Salirhabdus euzebyi]
MKSYSVTEKTQNKQNLARLFEALEGKNQIQAEKVLDLIDKREKEELVIGFAGHFSAGKSTMINNIIGENILPSSPIPTSANLVKVKSGNGYARVFYTHNPPVEYKEPYDLDTIKALCKDGESITKIEISKQMSVLPKHVTIMDTPGIDSSNDADRVITESGLHVVDVLFYVMDYNHVQSEVNLSFLREMQKRGKRVYIVINQIDKHQEEEIPFHAYQESIRHALKSWKIDPLGIYYTTLIETKHAFNQFEELQKLFLQLTQEKEEIIEQTISQSCLVILDELSKQLREEKEAEIEDLKEDMNHLRTRLGELASSKGSVEDKIKTVTEFPKEAEQTFKKELDSIFKSAYLMPFENREKAKAFLESMQPGFKMGLLFAKKKTEQEQEKRLNEFYNDLMKTVTSQLEWHIRDLFVKLAKRFDVVEPNLLQEIQQFTVDYPKSGLKDTVKTGAEVTGDYVLVYTNDVGNDIKVYTKQKALQIWFQMKSIMEKQSEVIASAEQSTLKLHEQLESKQRSLEEIEKDLTNTIDSLKDILFGYYSHSEHAMEKVYLALTDRKKSIQQKVMKKAEKKDMTKQEYAVSSQKDIIDVDTSFSVDDIINRLEKSASTLADVRGFQTIKQDLIEKRNRMDNRHFTVALFGAFSAGKSSFANALLGEKVLPVSPNPTTATINKISPSSQENPHGTVVVQLKGEQQLIEDIYHAAEKLPKGFTKLAEIKTWMDANDVSEYVQDQESKNVSFLQAFIDGYDDVKEKIGKQVTVSINESSSYIAEEKRACFVEWMEMFYDCDFTQNGITLVDTPGADSVNARHTDVSFEYIKNADVILFVTYYNHAFSRADREFLIQLGRVKDVFSLDKMFFLINAADLAKDDEELQLVTSYVEEQLLAYGIRNPRLFPVSSKWAMEEKVSKKLFDQKSGIQKFEEDFYHFIDEELTGLFIQSALHDLKRAAKLLEEHVKSASMNAAEKEKVKNIYQDDSKKMKDFILNFDMERHEIAVKQELDELVYYIQQRLFLRFIDMFKETINPAYIKSNGKKGKEELIGAVKQLIQYISHDLIQEIQATSLRTEKYMNKNIKSFTEELEKHDLMKKYQFSFPTKDDFSFETKKGHNGLDSIPFSAFHGALSIFKNTKSFFEQNEKNKFHDELKEILQPFVKEYLDNQKRELITFYLPQWNKEVEQVKTKMINVLEEYFDGLLYNVSTEIDVEELKRKLTEVQQLANEN